MSDRDDTNWTVRHDRMVEDAIRRGISRRDFVRTLTAGGVGLGTVACWVTGGGGTGAIGRGGSTRRASICTGSTTSGLRDANPACRAHSAAACRASTHAAIATTLRPLSIMGASPAGTGARARGHVVDGGSETGGRAEPWSDGKLREMERARACHRGRQYK